MTLVEESEERLSGIGSVCASNDRHAHDRAGAKGEERGLFHALGVAFEPTARGPRPLGTAGRGPRRRLGRSAEAARPPGPSAAYPYVPGSGPQPGVGEGQCPRIATRVVESDQTGQTRVIQDRPTLRAVPWRGHRRGRVELQADFGTPARSTRMPGAHLSRARLDAFQPEALRRVARPEVAWPRTRSIPAFSTTRSARSIPGAGWAQDDPRHGGRPGAIRVPGRERRGESGLSRRSPGR